MGFRVAVLGRGLVDSDELAVDRAVNEYDERLYFKRNEETGQYCVYIKTPANEPDIPILGWDYIPHPEDACKRLYQTDSLRHGEQILDDMNRRNAEYNRKFKDAADDATYQVAEAFESNLRAQGLHPNPRIFVPKGV